MCELVDELEAGFLSLVLEIVGNLRDIPRGAQIVAPPHQASHLNQVHHPEQIGFEPYRQLHHRGVGPQPLLNGEHGVLEIGPGAVELVDEADPGDAVLVGLAPNRLRLWLHPGDAVEQSDRAV